MLSHSRFEIGATKNSPSMNHIKCAQYACLRSLTPSFHFPNPSILQYFFGNTDFDISEGQDTDELIQRGVPGTEDAALAASNRSQALRDALTAVQDFTQEKRTVKREAMLRRFFKYITMFATGTAGYDIVSGASGSILAACQFSLRPGQAPAEQYAACRVLEAVSVVLGANEEDWVESLDETLRRTVMSTARATAVRVAALRALAMAVTLCAASDSVAAESLQDLCEAVAAPEYRNQAVPVALRAAAWDAWAILATLLDDLHLAGQDDVQMGRGLAVLHQLKECLDNAESSSELRSAAGQCLALIHEARVNLGVDADEGAPSHQTGGTAAEVLNTTARRFQKGSWDGSQFEVLMDEVKQRIAELSTESGHHMSKKAKKEQRATFREFMATIVDDEPPEEVINFRNNGSLTLSTWKEIIQLNFVRHSLQGGFQIQLLTNGTLQSMFGADGSIISVNQGGMSQVEKRLVLSKTSEAYKNADQDRRGKRDKRENIKNDFLTADGEDL